MPDNNIVFEIAEHIGVLARHETGWTKELNVVSWNGQTPKYDIRDWDPLHERMGRGVTLFPDEMKKLVDSYLKDNNKKKFDDAADADSAEKQESRGKRRGRPRKDAAPDGEAAHVIPEPDAELKQTEEACPF